MLVCGELGINLYSPYQLDFPVLLGRKELMFIKHCS